MALRPLPTISKVNAPFFKEAANGRLVIQYCAECQNWIYYPRYLCPECFSNELVWKTASGKGEIISYSLIYRPQDDFFESQIPIFLVAVELDEGPNMISTLADRDSGEPRIGDRVHTVFEIIEEELGLVHFERM